MEEMSNAHRARVAIKTYKTMAEALILRGFYKPSGKSGEKLSESLKLFSPEIYGSMSDSRIVELKGLEYVLDRLPRGIEKCNRIILTADEDFNDTSFEKIRPLKRRRYAYVVSETEICFMVSRGLSEIYDILTQLTFLNIESQKIVAQICDKEGGTCSEWHELENNAHGRQKPKGTILDQAIWNLSIILGRTYKETKECYEYFDQYHGRNGNYNNGLFSIIYEMGQRIINENKNDDSLLTIYFTPSLQEIIGHHKYARKWAKRLKHTLYDQKIGKRPVHVVSANMHSMRNLFYGAGFLKKNSMTVPVDVYEMIRNIRDIGEDVTEYASQYGLSYLRDTSESNIDVMIIDTEKNETFNVHEKVNCDFDYLEEEKPVIIVIDYAFGIQAFAIMDELFCPCSMADTTVSFNFASVNIIGKAGTLAGNTGDIMLATAHVMEGSTNNYIVDNDLVVDDFDQQCPIHVGPMVTVLGTSLQNRDVLERFHTSTWKAVGLEMEGGHFQRAISAAIIQGHVAKDIKIRYAYYASDNPLKEGQTLAHGSMGEDGIVPTYLISKVILQKIINPSSTLL